MINKPVTGSLFSLPDVRDYVGTTKVTEFPDEFKLAPLPAVKNQGQVSSCVAHALATVAEYYNRKETKNYKKMSTGYIYGNRMLSLHKGYGMYTRDAIKTMTKYGDVPYENFPQNVEVPEAMDLFESKMSELEDIGLNFKFKSYYKLKTIEAVKAHLMSGNPVIVTMKWFEDIKIVDGVMETNEVIDSTTGGHCMVIFGWNSTGWLVQNSWGTTWGNKGRFILPYSVSVKEVWGVTDAEPSDEIIVKKPYSSDFGKGVAAVINTIVQWLYKLFDKKKENT